MTHCPECEAEITVRDLLVGEITYCPDCNAELEVLRLEPPSYFKTDEPIADLMTYTQLRDYIAQLNASGAKHLNLHGRNRKALSLEARQFRSKTGRASGNQNHSGGCNGQGNLLHFNSPGVSWNTKANTPFAALQ